MDVEQLESGLRHVSGMGVCLNCFEINAIKIGLSILKKHENITGPLFFWGCLKGVEDDYFVAYVLQDSKFLFPCKKFFYSTRNFEFKLMPELSDEKSSVIQKLSPKFVFGRPRKNRSLQSGQPAEENSLSEDEGDEAQIGSKALRINDEDVLTFFVTKIDFATAAVPRGSFSLHKNQRILRAPEFKPLSLENLQNLKHWVHCRPAENLETLRAMASKDYQFNADFLESLSADAPRGSWVIRVDPSMNSVTVRSLLWRGYVAYACTDSTNFGGVYFGHGEDSADLPFLL